MNIKEELFKLQDLSYRDFHAKLMPATAKEKIIGVRTPMLRKFAKTVYKSGEYTDFFKQLPHKYYEENNLHAFLIEQMNDYDTAMAELEDFLPYIDNWATCDCFAPKVFGKNKDKLLPKIYKWIDSGDTYTVRYAVGMLMRYFLDEDFDEKYLAVVAGIRSDEYYVNMMLAWYFATALAKQRTEAMKYITEYRLNVWVHNKTIQKAVESFRISKEDKELLRTYRKRGM